MTPENENVNVGTEGHIDYNENVSDTTDVSDTSNNEQISEGEQATGKLGIKSILKALSSAKKDGKLSAHQVQRMRNDLGILGSFFTKPTANVKKKRAKRIAAKKARKVTYSKGFKGQKTSKGKR